jgi:hypothetical protein
MAGYIGNFPTAIPLSGTDIADGTITNSDLANSSVTVNGTSISLGASGTISAGITEADQWRLTTTFSATTGSTQVITSNLERVDGSGQGTLGSGMTESSGVFTFPSTGIYLVRFGIYTFDNNVWTYCYNKIEVTTNNSTYNNRAFGSTSMTGTMSNYPEQSTLIDTLVDVTDTANVKVRFAYTTPETISIAGDTDANKTYFTFIRLGDT